MRTLIMSRSMRTRIQQHADTYVAVCGHICSSMRGLAFAEAWDFGATNELREHLQQ
jgi:hypothetical protein